MLEACHRKREGPIDDIGEKMWSRPRWSQMSHSLRSEPKNARKNPSIPIITNRGEITLCRGFQKKIEHKGYGQQEMEIDFSRSIVSPSC